MITHLLAYKMAAKALYLAGVALNKDTINPFKEKVVPKVNVPFNKPHMTGFEQKYINDVLSSGKLCGDGNYAKKCQNLFSAMYDVNECVLTSSCSDALEMAAILLNIKPGDEVIMPSYTFVSTANAFILRGAKVVFADSAYDHPGMDENKIEELISPKTKAIVVVHYAGVATDMDKVMDIANRHNLLVVEDAAQAVDAFYKGRTLGTIGHLGTISFHETKNIVAGEGGMLLINDDRFIARAEIIREKGTDRTRFLRGEIDKYGWVDIGSSYLPNEMTAACLYAQLEQVEKIQQKRLSIWNRYYDDLKELEILGYAKMQTIPEYAAHNAHMFYIVLNDQNTRERLRLYLKENGISAVFHYTPLHSSGYFADKHDGRELTNCDKYDQCLLRLPMFADMTAAEQKTVTNKIWRFFLQK